MKRGCQAAFRAGVCLLVVAVGWSQEPALPTTYEALVNVPGPISWEESRNPAAVGIELGEVRYHPDAAACRQLLAGWLNSAAPLQVAQVRLSHPESYCWTLPLAIYRAAEQPTELRPAFIRFLVWHLACGAPPRPPNWEGQERSVWSRLVLELHLAAWPLADFATVCGDGERQILLRFVAVNFAGWAPHPEELIQFLGAGGGSPESLRWLRDLQPATRELAWWRLAALARLGDGEAETQLLREYEANIGYGTARDVVKAAAFASTEALIRRLARDVRNSAPLTAAPGEPEFWLGEEFDPRSWGHIVVSALMAARDFPRDTVREWSVGANHVRWPHFKAVDVWLTQKYHITWAEPWSAALQQEQVEFEPPAPRPLTAREQDHLDALQRTPLLATKGPVSFEQLFAALGRAGTVPGMVRPLSVRWGFPGYAQLYGRTRFLLWGAGLSAWEVMEILHRYWSLRHEFSEDRLVWFRDRTVQLVLDRQTQAALRGKLNQAAPAVVLPPADRGPRYTWDALRFPVEAPPAAGSDVRFTVFMVDVSLRRWRELPETFADMAGKEQLTLASERPIPLGDYYQMIADQSELVGVEFIDRGVVVYCKDRSWRPVVVDTPPPK